MYFLALNYDFIPDFSLATFVYITPPPFQSANIPIRVLMLRPKRIGANRYLMNNYLSVFAKDVCRYFIITFTKLVSINRYIHCCFVYKSYEKQVFFSSLFEPLKIHQTISNSNQTIHKTLYLMKMDKAGPKNNNFGSLIWKRVEFLQPFLSVFATFPNLADIYTIIRPSN